MKKILLFLLQLVFSKPRYNDVARVKREHSYYEFPHIKITEETTLASNGWNSGALDLSYENLNATGFLIEFQEFNVPGT